MRTSLCMYRDRVCSGVSKSRNELICIQNHEVHIEWELRHLPNLFHHRGSNRNIWNKMSVHHIYVNPIGSRRFNGLNFVFQTSKVCRQNGGGNDRFLHVPLLLENRRNFHFSQTDGLPGGDILPKRPSLPVLLSPLVELPKAPRHRFHNLQKAFEPQYESFLVLNGSSFQKRFDS